MDIADFPWQGSFRAPSGSHNCGCVFIGGSNVISAAHCGGTTSHTLEFGSSNRNSGTVVGISSVTRHPNYGQGAGFSPNDISTIITSSAVSGANISPGTMSTSAVNPEGTGFITGWGRTCGSCSLPVALQGTEIPIIADDQCSGIWGSSFQSSNMICVYGGVGGGIGACNGDSGGPLSGPGNGDTIFGVTSWGAGGCSTNYPSVYTKVGAFQSWVCEQTGNAAVGC